MKFLETYPKYEVEEEKRPFHTRADIRIIPPPRHFGHWELKKRFSTIFQLCLHKSASSPYVTFHSDFQLQSRALVHRDEESAFAFIIPYFGHYAITMAVRAIIELYKIYGGTIDAHKMGKWSHVLVRKYVDSWTPWQCSGTPTFVLHFSCLWRRWYNTGHLWLWYMNFKHIWYLLLTWT